MQGERSWWFIFFLWWINIDIHIISKGAHYTIFHTLHTIYVLMPPAFVLISFSLVSCMPVTFCLLCHDLFKFTSWSYKINYPVIRRDASTFSTSKININPTSHHHLNFIYPLYFFKATNFRPYSILVMNAALVFKISYYFSASVSWILNSFRSNRIF